MHQTQAIQGRQGLSDGVSEQGMENSQEFMTQSVVDTRAIGDQGEMRQQAVTSQSEMVAPQGRPAQFAPPGYHDNRQQNQDYVARNQADTNDSTLEAESDLESIQRKMARYLRRGFTRMDLWTWQDIQRTGTLEDRYVPLTLFYEDKEKKIKRRFEQYTDIFGQVGDDMQPVRIVIRGEPGAGKTTLVKKIIHDWCCTVTDNKTAGLETVAPVLQQYKIVLPVLLRSVEPGSSLRNTLKVQFPDLKEKEIDSIMLLIDTSPEQVLFLCDGYDELPTGIQSNMEKMILGELLCEVCCVTTTRGAAFSRLCQDHRSIDHDLEILGLTKAQTESFVKKSFSNDEKMAGALLSHILSSDVHCRLAEKPFLLQLMCFLWHKNGRLAGSEAELFTSFVELLLGRYDVKKGGVKERSRSAIFSRHHSILMDIGRLADTGRGDDGIKYVFSQQKVNEILGDDAEKLGFLHKIYPSSPLEEAFWSFLHPSIQEFMIVYYISNTNASQITNERSLADLPFPFVSVFPVMSGWTRVVRRHSLLHFLCALNPSLANQLIQKAICDDKLERVINHMEVLLELQANYRDIDRCNFPLPKMVLVDLKKEKVNLEHMLKLFQADQNHHKNIILLKIIALDKTHQHARYVATIIPCYITFLQLTDICITKSLAQRIGTLQRLEKLFLEKISVDGAGGDFLGSLSSLKLLSVDQCSFITGNTVKVGEMFPGTLLMHNRLEYLSLIKCQLMYKDFEKVSNSLLQPQFQSVLKELDISGNMVDSGQLIGVLLSRFPQLERLICTECNIDIADIDSGIDTLHNALIELSCSQNKTTSGVNVARLLKKLPSLKRFNAYSCKINAKAFEAFFFEMEGISSRLEDLNLANNTIAFGSSTHFAKLISLCSCLQSLDLEACNIDHSTFTYFLKGWTRYPKAVTSLSLAHNHLDNESVLEFLSYVKNSQIGSSLQKLNLKGNSQISNTESVVDLFKELHALNIIDITGCGIGVDLFTSRLEDISQSEKRTVSFVSDGKQITLCCPL